MALNTNNFINDFADDIHTRNVKAGWWTNPQTGEDILVTRDRLNLLKLVVSEVSEADHGREEELNDDKLPHLPMFNVEIADVAIRVFDMIGAENRLAGDRVEIDIEAKHSSWADDLVDDFDYSDRWFKAVVNTASKATEHYRKSRTKDARETLMEIIVVTEVIAEFAGFDLYDVIDQKVNFNANRPDHKMENRLLDGGKKF